MKIMPSPNSALKSKFDTLGASLQEEVEWRYWFTQIPVKKRKSTLLDYFHRFALCMLVVTVILPYFVSAEIFVASMIVSIVMLVIANVWEVSVTLLGDFFALTSVGLFIAAIVAAMKAELVTSYYLLGLMFVPLTGMIAAFIGRDFDNEEY